MSFVSLGRKKLFTLFSHYQMYRIIADKCQQQQQALVFDECCNEIESEKKILSCFLTEFAIRFLFHATLKKNIRSSQNKKRKISFRIKT